MTRPSLPDVFDGICKAGKFKFAPEHKFHPKRRWRFDRADLKNKIAVEFEGGVWVQGRHTRGSGFVKDCEKYNAAASMGWVVLRYATAEQLAEFPEHYRGVLESR